LAAVVVNHPGMGNGEDQGTKPGGTAVDGAKTRQDGQEHFLHGRLRILDAPGSEIAEDL
jgi:hypothetical protein